MYQEFFLSGTPMFDNAFQIGKGSALVHQYHDYDSRLVPYMQTHLN